MRNRCFLQVGVGAAAKGAHGTRALEASPLAARLVLNIQIYRIVHI